MRTLRTLMPLALGAVAGVTGAFLAVDLGGRTLDLGAVFGLSGALTLAGLEQARIEVDGVIARLDAEDVVGERHLSAGGLALNVDYGEFHEKSSLGG